MHLSHEENVDFTLEASPLIVPDIDRCHRRVAITRIMRLVEYGIYFKYQIVDIATDRTYEMASILAKDRNRMRNNSRKGIRKSVRSGNTIPEE